MLQPLKSFAEDVAQETLVDSRVNIICEQLLSAEATLKLVSCYPPICQDRFYCSMFALLWP